MSRTGRLLTLSLLLLLVPASRGWADEGRIQLFRQELSARSRTEPESITRAAMRFKQIFQPAPVAERDRGFLVFVGFFHQVEEGVGKAAQDREISRGDAAAPASQRPGSAEQRGHVLRGRGRRLPVTPPLRSFLSPAYGRFLAIRQKEMREGFTEDAGAARPLPHAGRAGGHLGGLSSANTLRLWQREQAAHYRSLYLATFLTGIDNSRVFGMDGKVEPEVRRAWRHVMKTWPNTAHGTPRGRVPSSPRAFRLPPDQAVRALPEGPRHPLHAGRPAPDTLRVAGSPLRRAPPFPSFPVDHGGVGLQPGRGGGRIAGSLPLADLWARIAPLVRERRLRGIFNRGDLPGRAERQGPLRAPHPFVAAD